MLGFSTSSHDSRSSVIDDGVCWQANGRWERCSPGCHIGGCWLDEANEVVCPILIVGDIEEEWIEDVPEHGEVVVARLASDVLECCCCGGEERCDFFRCHRGDAGPGCVVDGGVGFGKTKNLSSYVEAHHGGGKI